MRLCGFVLAPPMVSMVSHARAILLPRRLEAAAASLLVCALSARLITDDIVDADARAAAALWLPPGALALALLMLLTAALTLSVQYDDRSRECDRRVADVDERDECDAVHERAGVRDDGLILAATLAPCALGALQVAGLGREGGSSAGSCARVLGWGAYGGWFFALC